MGRIIVNDAAQFGIQGTIKSKPIKNEAYKKLASEADMKIEKNRHYYANAYKRASGCLAR